MVYALSPPLAAGAEAYHGDTRLGDPLRRDTPVRARRFTRANPNRNRVDYRPLPRDWARRSENLLKRAPRTLSCLVGFTSFKDRVFSLKRPMARCAVPSVRPVSRQIISQDAHNEIALRLRFSRSCPARKPLAPGGRWRDKMANIGLLHNLLERGT